MIRFELAVSNPRASGALLHGYLQLTTAGQVYAIPFDADFESDLCQLYEAIASLTKKSMNCSGTFRDESSEVKTYHSWTLVKNLNGQTQFLVYKLTAEKSQKEVVLEYSGPWLKFILDFSQISENNSANELWDILTAWNTLRKRNHEKTISISKILYSAQDVLYVVFRSVTYPVTVAELYKAFYLGLFGKCLLHLLHLKYELIQQKITPLRDYLLITWRLNGSSLTVYRKKIDWRYFDEVFLKGENIQLFRHKSPILIIPKSIFAGSVYADYAEDYAYHFGIYLYDGWFHKTQFWQ